ncbi:GNAT family N-acetyltransferase [Bhargavaea massiliensis]|uniref:GNAT family N-acetyltransferase n=1 Tax=Bhargavaea massiliensis TaxID=2697500 RepID=UPI001BCCB5A5|nr:GNAT family N-acetyltransferase [Bhargavaea massiliensis]
MEQPVIRSFEKEEVPQASELERAVWGSATPPQQFMTAMKNGGLLIGAFIGGQAVGFQYSFAGFDGKRPYLCSHMLALLPEYRHSGLGAAIKRHQAELAREIGYDWIQWTFDPLESRNAYLNIRKLGGVVSTYWENCYGEMKDPLNAGLPTDRFRLDWWIDSTRVTDGIRQPELTAAHPYTVSFSGSGQPVLDEAGSVPDADAFVVPVPADFQAMRKEDMALAIDWRKKTRGIFTEAFRTGYMLADVRRKDSLLNEYILYRKEHVPL